MPAARALTELAVELLLQRTARAPVPPAGAMEILPLCPKHSGWVAVPFTVIAGGAALMVKLSDVEHPLASVTVTE